MNLLRLYETLRPLRAAQWTDRLWRPVKARMLPERKLSEKNLQAAQALPLCELPRFITSDAFDPATGEANFLNVPHHFNPEKIDWNFRGHGKLWTYHLNYFGWLERLDDATASFSAMQDFCRRTTSADAGAEVYPASRRVQHWMSAVLRFGLHDEEIFARLYADAWRIARLPERHLGANHLLQNGLAVFAAALFFDDENLFLRVERLLDEELRKQFFEDGGHIERSASYAADLCARMIWCIHLQKHTRRFQNKSINNLLQHTARRAHSWLEAYAFSDGSCAAIGDSSVDMMPPLQALRDAAREAGIFAQPAKLTDSNYRKIKRGPWEAVLNVGSPSPPYQPGHSHADALTFCLHVHGRSLVVDTGISTYERDARRAYVRSTEAHNTVVVEGKNSSDVWASFRMGRRARVKILSEEEAFIEASHDGYYSLGVTHLRKFDGRDKDVFQIQDALQTDGLQSAVSLLHFHPDVAVEKTGDNAWRAADCTIEFFGMKAVTAEPYLHATGFNARRQATRLRCVWEGLETSIYFRA